MMKKFLVNKKGAEETGITTGQIIFAVLAILALAIVWYWWFFVYNAQEEMTDQTCRNSIIMRNALNLKLTDVLVNAVPLKCETQRICYTQQGWLKSTWEAALARLTRSQKDRAECPKGYKKVLVKDKEQLIADLVKRQANWWSIVGEGTLNYVPRGWVFNREYCAIASNIVFDYSIFDMLKKERTDAKGVQTVLKTTYDDGRQNEIIEGYITYKEYWDYMENHNVTAGKNYIEYFNEDLVGGYTEKDLEDYFNNIRIENGNPPIDFSKKAVVDVRKRYIITTSIIPDSAFLRFIKVGTLPGALLSGGASKVSYSTVWLVDWDYFQQENSCYDFENVA